MYNLLVAYAGWNPPRASIDRSRLLEYTTDALKNQLKPSGALDIEAVLRLPTVFMSETNGSGEQIARVGTIARIQEVGRHYQIDFSYDTSVPSFSNSKAAELAYELGIEEWELSRTHWAIKDVDLFRVLLLMSTARASIPQVFHLSDQLVDDDLVSVMMPFDASFNAVYDTLKSAVEALGKQCRRADDIWRHEIIIQDVVSLICTSSIVICDLSKKNANVFYEAGIAHTLGKNVILIAQSIDDVPFNLRHLRFTAYHDNGEGRRELAESITARIGALAR
jgi:hypothetical protein